MSHVSRRAVAKGAAWSIPAVTVTGAAPAIAASTGSHTSALTTTFYVSGPCSGGGNDHYLYVNVQNNTDTSFTLPAPVVVTVTSSAVDRNHTAATTSWGTLTCNTNESMTACDSMTWTIPAGTTVPARNANQIDLGWHFLADFANPTTVSAAVTQGAAYFTNPSTSTDAGWTGTSNCNSTSKL